MKKGTGTDPSGGGAAMDQVVRLAPEPFYVLSIERIRCLENELPYLKYRRL